MHTMGAKVGVTLLGTGLLLGSGLGCGTGQSVGGAAAADEYLTLRTEGASWQMRIEPSGRVSGADIELAATGTGYRGMVGGQLADMFTADGRRIVGTRGGLPIDLHVAAAGEAISATGTFAGTMGRVELAGQGMSSSVGRCTVVLERQDERRYVGQRNCRGSARFSRTELEVPAAFALLSPERKIMLLAALTGS